MIYKQKPRLLSYVLNILLYETKKMFFSEAMFLPGKGINLT